MGPHPVFRGFGSGFPVDVDQDPDAAFDFDAGPDLAFHCDADPC